MHCCICLATVGTQTCHSVMRTVADLIHVFSLVILMWIIFVGALPR